jgi:hypothetical protein
MDCHSVTIQFSVRKDAIRSRQVRFGPRINKARAANVQVNIWRRRRRRRVIDGSEERCPCSGARYWLYRPFLCSPFLLTKFILPARDYFSSGIANTTTIWKTWSIQFLCLFWTVVTLCSVRAHYPGWIFSVSSSGIFRVKKGSIFQLFAKSCSSCRTPCGSVSSSGIFRVKKCSDFSTFRQ